MRWPPLLLIMAITLIPGITISADDLNERLVLEPFPGPAKWKEVTNKSGPDGWMRESIPSDQEAPNHKDIFVSQAFNKLPSADPADFMNEMMKRSTSVCEKVRVNGPNTRTESGYEVAYGQVFCGKQKEKDFGLQMWIKVLKGKNALYVVQREFRVPVSEVGGVISFSKEQMQEMVAIMDASKTTDQYLVRDVYLCGGQHSDPRCNGSTSKR
jgi:hypothetical protein